VKRNRRFTLRTGVNPEPESVPHAEGVKLCDPTYAYPTMLPWSSLTSTMSESTSDLGFLSGEDPEPRNVAIIICTFNWKPHVKANIATCTDIATNLAMHQHPSTPAPRLVKQVSGKLGCLPRPLATEHRTATGLSKHATLHPVPRREQYLYRVR